MVLNSKLRRETVFLGHPLGSGTSLDSFEALTTSFAPRFIKNLEPSEATPLKAFERFNAEAKGALISYLEWTMLSGEIGYRHSQSLYSLKFSDSPFRHFLSPEFLTVASKYSEIPLRLLEINSGRKEFFDWIEAEVLLTNPLRAWQNPGKKIAEYLWIKRAQQIAAVIRKFETGEPLSPEEFDFAYRPSLLNNDFPVEPVSAIAPLDRLRQMDALIHLGQKSNVDFYPWRTTKQYVANVPIVAPYGYTIDFTFQGNVKEIVLPEKFYSRLGHNNLDRHFEFDRPKVGRIVLRDPKASYSLPYPLTTDITWPSNFQGSIVYPIDRSPITIKDLTFDSEFFEGIVAPVTAKHLENKVFPRIANHIHLRIEGSSISGTRFPVFVLGDFRLVGTNVYERSVELPQYVHGDAHLEIRSAKGIRLPYTEGRLILPSLRSMEGLVLPPGMEMTQLVLPAGLITNSNRRGGTVR